MKPLRLSHGSIHAVLLSLILVLCFEQHSCFHGVPAGRIQWGILPSTSFPSFNPVANIRLRAQPKRQEKTVVERTFQEADIATVASSPSSALSQSSKFTTPSSTSSLSSTIASIVNTTEVDKIISNLPIGDKYALLIQSYAGKILESASSNSASEKVDRDLLKKIEVLYSEMILRSITPEKKSIQNIIDASSTFCNVETFSKSLKLLKKGKA